MPQALPPVPPAFEIPAEIVVTGKGLGAQAGEAAYDVVTIDRERLTSVASGRLEDVLRDVAGFGQFRRSDARSAHPTSQGATLRGLGGNASSRALVTLDGVPLADPFGGNITFPAIDPSRLGMVRVTRGGGTGRNGPGALAGTIALESAEPEQLGLVTGALAYGSRNSIDGHAGLSGHAGAGFVTVSAAYARGDGFVPIVKGQRGPADRAADYDQASLAARAIVPVAPQAELQAGMLVFRDSRERGLAGTDNRTTGADANLRLVVTGRWGFEALGYVQMRRFESGFASATAGRVASNKTLDQYNVPALGYGGRIELSPPIGPGIDLRIGADARATQGETDELFTYVAGLPTRTREAGGRTLTTGLFADLSLVPADGLTLTAAARIDRWRISDGRLIERALGTAALLTNSPYANRHGTETTARGGASYALAYAFKLRGAAYLGWRLPTLNELYRPFRAGVDATGANPLLKPERLKGVDAGIDWEPVNSLRFGLTGFWNHLDDAIGNVTKGAGPGTYPGVGFVAAGGAYRQRDNLDAVVSRGVELEAHARDGRFSLDASWAWIDAKVQASGAAAGLDGLRPAQTPKQQVSATLGYESLMGVRAAATVRYLAGQYEDDQNSRQLAAATTLDMSVSVPIYGGLALELRGENVTNRRIEATIAADGTVERASPRTLWVGLRLGR